MRYRVLCLALMWCLLLTSIAFAGSIPAPTAPTGFEAAVHATVPAPLPETISQAPVPALDLGVFERLTPASATPSPAVCSSRLDRCRSRCRGEVDCNDRCDCAWYGCMGMELPSSC